MESIYWDVYYVPETWDNAPLHSPLFICGLFPCPPSPSEGNVFEEFSQGAFTMNTRNFPLLPKSSFWVYKELKTPLEQCQNQHKDVIDWTDDSSE